MNFELTNQQHEIVSECLELKNKTGRGGGISIPMGGGKTLISLYLSTIITEKPVLICVSKSLIYNWVSEIKRFFPNETFTVFHDSYQKISMENEQILTSFKFVIITPDMLVKYYKRLNLEYRLVMHDEVNLYDITNKPFVKDTVSKLFGYKWGCLIVDEVQNYNKCTTAICRSLMSINSDYVWLLSGTIFNEISAERLLGYYLILGNVDFPDNIPNTRKLIHSARFKGVRETMVVRERNSSYTEPKKNFHIIVNKMTDEEERVYTLMKDLMDEIFKAVSYYKTVKDPENTRLFSNCLTAMVLYFRQSLVSPLIPISSAFMDFCSIDRDKTLSKIILKKLDEHNLKDYVNDAKSCKSSRIKEIETVVNKVEKCILVCSFRSFINLLKEYIDIPFFTLDSSMNVKKRSETIEEFKQSKSGVLCITYGIGGEGLNLQFCKNILICDFWWNKGATQQAIGRINRPGQQSSEIDIYFFTSNTRIENEILKKHIHKEKVIGELFDGSVKTLQTRMKMQDIVDFISIGENKETLSKTYF